jgi:hypothetical protein
MALKANTKQELAHLVGGKGGADHQRRGDSADEGRSIPALEVTADTEF